MKLLGRFLSVAVLIATVVAFANCGGDDGPEKTEQEIQAEKLAGTWSVQEVLYEDAPPAQSFTNFKLTITTGMSWTATGRPTPSPWDSQGTFTFGSPVASQLVRKPDNVNITYSFPSANTLIMQFNLTGAGYDGDDSRAKSVEGNWKFTMTK